MSYLIGFHHTAFLRKLHPRAHLRRTMSVPPWREHKMGPLFTLLSYWMPVPPQRVIIYLLPAACRQGTPVPPRREHNPSSVKLFTPPRTFPETCASRSRDGTLCAAQPQRAWLGVVVVFVVAVAVVFCGRCKCRDQMPLLAPFVHAGGCVPRGPPWSGQWCKPPASDEKRTHR